MRPLDPIKKEKILQAVFSIVGQQGLADVQISTISEASGVGVGSIYTYFKTKEELIQAAYSYAEDKVTAIIYKGYDAGQPIKNSLKKIYINTLKYRLKHYNESVFIDQYIRSGYVQLNLKKQVREFELQNKPLYEIIARGQKEGVIIETKPFTLINFINGAIRSSSNGMAQRLISVSKDTIEICFLMTWKGISK